MMLGARSFAQYVLPDGHAGIPLTLPNRSFVGIAISPGIIVDGLVDSVAGVTAFEPSNPVLMLGP